MVRAVLATIETQKWTVEGKVLLGGQVVQFYYALPDVSAASKAVGGNGCRSDRRFDRAAQLLRRKGLIHFKDGAWSRVSDGGGAS